MYGSSPGRMNAWPPEFLKNAVIFMDSRTNNRRQRSPHYKSNREERRENSVRSYETWRMVKNFQSLVVEDPRLRFYDYPGCEADDLVALAAWRFGDPTEPLRTFGIDKDLLQIGEYFLLINKDGEEVTLGHFHEGLPKALHGHGDLEARHIPMILAILGDKSDAIPRLLDPGVHALGRLAHVLWGTDKPWDEIVSLGDGVARNLYDVILPDPELFGLGPEDVIPLLKGDHWNPTLMKALNRPLRRAVRSWILKR